MPRWGGEGGGGFFLDQGDTKHYPQKQLRGKNTQIFRPNPSTKQHEKNTQISDQVETPLRVVNPNQPIDQPDLAGSDQPDLTNLTNRIWSTESNQPDLTNRI